MLTIQFGQCGNQVGHTLFSDITTDMNSANTGVSNQYNSDYVQVAFDQWFQAVSKNDKHIARAILVDTEQKVINKVCSDPTSTWKYSTRGIVCRARGGAANNWANGYSVIGSQLGDMALEAVRNAIEKIDSFKGILSILSSAGGTGSGVGSRIIEQARDEFPSKTLASAIILPYVTGEVATQNYNTLLTLSKFLDISDIIITFRNDQIQNICTNLLKIFDTQFSDMNRIISYKLAATLNPVLDTRNILSSIVGQITPHPQYKLAAIKSTPHASVSSLVYDVPNKWPRLIRHLKQMLRIPTLDSELPDMETRVPSNIVPSYKSQNFSKSVGNVLITRGPSLYDNPINMDEMLDEKLYVNWVPPSQRVTHFHETRKLLAQDQFSVLITNNSHLQRPINDIAEKAWNAYVHSAFLHQYKQYGMNEDDFLEAFAKIENMIKAYVELNRVHN